ncbi:hypothetical protein [Candidatus Contubernalis alkaliaceticus]|uniref:hypothetical protein n=1 Tax=Candidatus Contubernalis alkaliaceticus TaxID=338645 RepID=UPI001F4BDB01|nr:hypothetical protein [Candidatus Contubernalis alkalaceticus]UNC90608.1 hypothetical protein HUE98_10000 [Candidatus Contubernalis alkalaceticus]
MGLFGGKDKEDKKQEEMEKFMRKYRLANLDDNDLEAVREISQEFMGLGLMKAGMALSLAKAEEQAKVGYLAALVKQNWIIIRKLDEISKKLDK